jgi:hypothetical protein
MTAYDLCFSKDKKIHQYANPAGQSYYVDIATNETSYSIPAGYEDTPQVRLPEFMVYLG